MGQIGAEAKGIVRAEISRLRTSLDQPLADYIAGKIRKITKPFDNGKRISQATTLSIDNIFKTLAVPNIITNNSFIYAQPSNIIIRSDSSEYEDTVLNLRTMHIFATRKKVSFWDHTIGVQFSAHALGRIVERGNIKDNVLETAFQYGVSMIPYVVPLTYFDDVVRFAAPFMNGIALGEKIVFDKSLSPLLHYVEDYFGFGLQEEQRNTLFNHPMNNNVIAYRVNTFLDWDALNDSQEYLMTELKNSYRDLEQLEASVLRAALIPPLSIEIDDEQVRAHMGIYSRITESTAWRDTVKTSP